MTNQGFWVKAEQAGSDRFSEFTWGLLASTSLHCRKNSLRFPQFMYGSSTIGFSPSSIQTWVIGSRFLEESEIPSFMKLKFDKDLLNP